MSIELYISKPGTTGTSWATQQVMEAAQGLRQRPVVCLGNALQRRAWQRRMAESGGVIGVQLVTFQGLAHLCLGWSGSTPNMLDNNLQYRLLRTMLNRLELNHYAAIANTAGFAVELGRVLDELQRAMITPGKLRASPECDASPALSELASLYESYQAELNQLGRLDQAGLVCAAADALAQAKEDRLCELIVVDGISDYSLMQVVLLKELSRHTDRMVILLSDDPDTDRTLFEKQLSVQANKLDIMNVKAQLDIQDYLKSTREPTPIPGVELVAAPDSEYEIREALRWIKARIVVDGTSPEETALVARNVSEKIAVIEQIADEFDLPVSIEAGRPLDKNPCIATLMTLLESLQTLPNGDIALRPREFELLLNSPYLDWQHAGSAEGEPIDWLNSHTAALSAIGRRGIVIEGLGQWREALSLACSIQPARHSENPACAPELAADISFKFERIIKRILPPESGTCRDWVGWLEDLIGDVTEDPLEQSSLGMARLIETSNTWAGRDRGALSALKDILRALVDAEQLFGTTKHSYHSFVQELFAAVRATTYRPETRGHLQAIQVLNASRCARLSFSAVALVGLAEGEFPRPQQDDILLPEAQRAKLRQQGLALSYALCSREQDFLLDCTACARDRLLCTRPRLAEGGALWSPSPFWEKLARLACESPVHLSSSASPEWSLCASWDEALTAAGNAKVEWQSPELEKKLAHITASERILAARRERMQGSAHNGFLVELCPELEKRFNATTVWSATRLETYASCPFRFFVQEVLHLAKRQEARLGPDSRQLGSVLHRILESTYQKALAGKEQGIRNLLITLDQVCDNELEQAPALEGFRKTAWWSRTRAALKNKLEHSVQAIESKTHWVPNSLEMKFNGKKPITLDIEGQELVLHLRGTIDRVDRDQQGNIRIVDYKTGGANNYTAKRAEQGELLQLALYGLAVEQVLELGQVSEGFYWHVLAAKPSPLKLDAAQDNSDPESAAAIAMRYAVQAAEAISRGEFVPDRPMKGCPEYCPAAAFCELYQSQRGNR